MRVATPALTMLALVLTGCGVSGADDTLSGSAASTVPVAQTCQQIAPDGGIGAMQDVTDFAEELSEVEDFEAAMAMSDRARELVETFDPIIATADDSIRPDLEAVAAVPRLIVETQESGEQNLNLEFAGFADGGSAVLETCFSDTSESEATDGDSTALIGRDTAVDAYCGTLVDGYKIEAPSTDVTTFGEAWDLIADGQSCNPHEGEDFSFAFEEGTDSAGNRVPREEYREPVEEMWEGFDDAEQAEQMVTTAIDMCLYRPDDPLGSTDSPGSIRHYGSSLALCPGHPQSEQRRELLEYLPQAQEDFDQLLKEVAAEESQSSAEPSEEALSESSGDMPITGDYAADLAALGIEVDDVDAYRLFMYKNICLADLDDAAGPNSLRIAVRPWDPAATRLAVAYDCPERMDAVEEAIEAYH